MRLAIRCLQIILLQALLLFFLLATHARAAFAVSSSNPFPHSVPSSSVLSSYATPNSKSNSHSDSISNTNKNKNTSAIATCTFLSAHTDNDPASLLRKRDPDEASLADPVSTTIPTTATSKSAPSSSSHSGSPPPPLPTTATNDTKSNHTSSIVDGKAVVKTYLQCNFEDAFCNKVLAAVDGAAQAFSQVVSIKIGIL